MTPHVKRKWNIEPSFPRISLGAISANNRPLAECSHTLLNIQIRCSPEYIGMMTVATDILSELAGPGPETQFKQEKKGGGVKERVLPTPIPLMTLAT